MNGFEDIADGEGVSLGNETIRSRTSGAHSREAAEFIGRSIAHIEKAFTGKRVVRNLTLFGLLAAPPMSFFLIALRPSPRQLWAQRWPTIAFAGLYQIALDRCVEIKGLSICRKPVR